MKILSPFTDFYDHHGFDFYRDRSDHGGGEAVYVRGTNDLATTSTQIMSVKDREDAGRWLIYPPFAQELRGRLTLEQMGCSVGVGAKVKEALTAAVHTMMENQSSLQLLACQSREGVALTMAHSASSVNHGRGGLFANEVWHEQARLRCEVAEKSRTFKVWLRSVNPLGLWDRDVFVRRVFASVGPLLLSTEVVICTMPKLPEESADAGQRQYKIIGYGLGSDQAAWDAVKEKVETIWEPSLSDPKYERPKKSAAWRLVMVPEIKSLKEALVDPQISTMRSMAATLPQGVRLVPDSANVKDGGVPLIQQLHTFFQDPVIFMVPINNQYSLVAGSHQGISLDSFGFQHLIPDEIRPHIYQMIEGHVGRMRDAAIGSPPVNLSNNERIKKAGFDLKTSFRSGHRNHRT